MEVEEEAITMEVEPMATKEEDYHHHQPTQTGTQMIIKGKRTKRQRPQSPIPFLVTAVNSSSATGDGGGLDLDPPADMSPPTNSGDFPATSATEEEEDMANCLILLAQGQSRQLTPAPPVQDDNHNAMPGVYTYNKVPAISSSKLGLYVYECKTCSRTFPSFQALGGHRASHKKPKLAAAAAAAEEKRRLQQRSAEKEYFGQFKNSNVNSPHSLSLQLSSRSAMHACNNNRSKLHECSICGAEFSSGQALGGHMRRHRGMVPPTATNAAAAATTLSLMSPMALDQTEEELIISSNNSNNNNKSNDDYKKPSNEPVNGGAGGLSLSLDLNLPAPDDERETNKFGFPSKQQQEQSHLVFSTPTLVDCQY